MRNLTAAMLDKLTIVGASARAAAHSALRAGLAPYAIDLFADRDLTAVCPATRIQRYPADFVEALAAAPHSPWIYTGGLENHPRLVECLAALRPLMGNPGRALRLVRDPARLTAAVENAGCHFPSWTARPAADAGWLVKPRHSSGGKAIRWATPTALPAKTAGLYWQQHIAGQSASAVYVAAGGRAVLLGTTRQLLGSDFGLDRPFLYAGSIGPLLLAPSEIERLVALGNVLARQFDLCGLFNVDFIRNDAGLWVLEVNPRYSASVEVLERVTGAHFIRPHLAACQQQLLPAVSPPAGSNFAGKAVVYANRKCRVGSQFAGLVDEWNQEGELPGIADLPAAGQSFSRGDPVATVFASGESVQTVEEVLRSRVAGVLQVLSTEY